jgi:hypothetical protein
MIQEINANLEEDNYIELTSLLYKSEVNLVYPVLGIINDD